MSDPRVKPRGPREDDEKRNSAGESGPRNREEDCRGDLRRRESDRGERAVVSGQTRVEQEHPRAVSEYEPDDDACGNPQRFHDLRSLRR